MCSPDSQRGHGGICATSPPSPADACPGTPQACSPGVPQQFALECASTLTSMQLLCKLAFAASPPGTVDCREMPLYCTVQQPFDLHSNFDEEGGISLCQPVASGGYKYPSKKNGIQRYCTSHDASMTQSLRVGMRFTMEHHYFLNQHAVQNETSPPPHINSSCSVPTVARSQGASQENAASPPLPHT